MFWTDLPLYNREMRLATLFTPTLPKYLSELLYRQLISSDQTLGFKRKPPLSHVITIRRYSIIFAMDNFPWSASDQWEQFLQSNLHAINSPVNNYGFTVLHLAVQRGYLTLVNMLIAQGVDLETRTSNGDSALLIACQVILNCIIYLLN